MESLLKLAGVTMTGWFSYGGQANLSQQYIINTNLKSLQIKDENMANIYWTGEKASKEETVSALMRELADCTDSRYHVRFESDGTGAHVCAIIETIHTNDTSKFVWKKELPDKFMGWRLIRVFVPIGYIKGIILAKEISND
tara:strand:+ start:608 stop:1030 length:423 start_codon:yes stop_codon:yes gene_type:complete